MEGLLQPTHLFFILLIVLILFGPGKLPDLGRGLGKGIREFKRSISEASDAVTQLPEDRNTTPRHLDAPPQSAPTSGEPKRLSQ